MTSIRPGGLVVKLPQDVFRLLERLLNRMAEHMIMQNKTNHYATKYSSTASGPKSFTTEKIEF